MSTDGIVTLGGSIRVAAIGAQRMKKIHIGAGRNTGCCLSFQICKVVTINILQSGRVIRLWAGHRRPAPSGLAGSEQS
jgi:hypothetical protein